MVEGLLTLAIKESVRLDPDRLEQLYRQMGPGAAEDVICRAVEELAIRLTRCERDWRDGDMTALRKNARSLIAIAEQIGMTAMAGVAGDVTRTIDAGDGPAIGATLFRLIRVGERSLTAVWDIQDLSV